MSQASAMHTSDEQRMVVVGVDSSALEARSSPVADRGDGGGGVSHNETPEPRPETPGLALKLGIAGAVALGAIASGFILSRQGRRVMREAWQGRRRTRLEDRVLGTIWDDAVIGRRTLDVQELAPGVIAVSGDLRDRLERDRVIDLVQRVEGVRTIEDRLSVVPSRRTSLARARARARLRRERERRV
jgi:hypothetical protein